MRIWAFDPGAVETGLAYGRLDKDNKLVALEALQYGDLHMVWDTFLRLRDYNDVVLIEEYRSAGQLTPAARATIQVVGALQFAVELDADDGPGSYLMRVEQHRLSGRREAAAVLGDTIENLEKDKGRKDGFSALAHVFAYWRTMYA